MVTEREIVDFISITTIDYRLVVVNKLIEMFNEQEHKDFYINNRLKELKYEKQILEIAIEGLLDDKSKD
jgi:hypothetical protein